MSEIDLGRVVGADGLSEYEVEIGYFDVAGMGGTQLNFRKPFGGDDVRLILTPFGTQFYDRSVSAWVTGINRNNAYVRSTEQTQVFYIAFRYKGR